MKTETESKLTVESCSDGEAWDAFIERNDGSPFALWGWGEAVATYGYDRWYLVAREGDRIVGALPLVHVRSRLFNDMLVSLPYTSQGDLVTAGPRPEEVKRRLLAKAKRLADRLDVDVASVRATDLGECRDFTTRTRYVTFQIPVDGDVDEVRGNVSRSRRRNVRAAEDNDSLEYVVGDSLADLRAFYRLYLQSMRGHGSPPHSFEFFRVLWDRLHDDGHLRVGLVRKDGITINANMDLVLGSRAIQKAAVLDYEYRDLDGGSLLNWNSMKWACESGRDYYELGRTREGTGVHTFKRSFGGEEVDLVDCHYYPNGEVSLADAEDERFDLPKRIWRKLPLPVTRMVGPRIRKGITL